MKKKLEIINKEKKDEEKLKMMKEHEQKLIGTRYDCLVINNINKMKLTKELDDWA